MANDYFLRNAEGKIQGPYDLLTMVRWIKRGKLTRKQELLSSPYEPPQLAEQFPELLSVFEDEDNAIYYPEGERIAHSKPTFLSTLAGGWEHFTANQVLAVLTGVFVIVAFVGLMIFSGIFSGTGFYVAMVIWLQVIFTFYLAAMLRKSRLQLLHGSYFGELIGRHGLRLVMTALLIILLPGIIPAILTVLFGPVALLLIAVPGSLLLAFLIFIPLIIVDRDSGIAAAFALNMKKMKQGGLNNYTIIYGLLVINVVLPILPITLPVTFVALCHLYDREFNEF